MARRSTPERLHAARRAATMQRLMSEGELPAEAEAWIGRWEAVADAEGRPRDGGYWEEAWGWIAAQRNGPPSPPV